ncbi:MAG TPA: S8 family serine peptidase [Acidimicrobiales bacterium]|nr:S8 family serine peptidase [Acidimicrobiales bacterium]
MLLSAALGSLALLVSGVAAPAGASAAGPSGPCGPAGQPCTWNFSPDAGSTHGADVYAGQALGREGAGVLVAVIDTWVDPSHPDFTGRVVDEADCIGGACTDHTYAKDSCTHGTHVAGTIASASFGVAPEADILAVQVLSDGGSSGASCSGAPADIANGINFAVAHHARVINLSVGELVPGVLQDSGVTAAVHAAASAGAVVVFAAGNSSSPGVTDTYGNDALLVAATGPDGNIAGYSNSGGSVALGAPGGDDGAVVVDLSGCSPANSDGSNMNGDCVLSTFPNSQYGLDEGTSMASPHVSGAAALLFAENPNRSRDDVIHALESTAHPLAGAGSGLLDVGKALALEPPATAGAGAGTQPSVPAGAATSSRSSTAARSPVYSSSAALGISNGAGQPAPTTAPVPTTTSSIPPYTVPDGQGSHRSAAGPEGASKGSSVAIPGGIAAALLAAAGAGTGVLGRRRRGRQHRSGEGVPVRPGRRRAG